jgi:hypothetical protein
MGLINNEPPGMVLPEPPGRPFRSTEPPGRFFRFTDTGKTNIPDRHMTISESRQAKYRENKRQTKEEQ